MRFLSRLRSPLGAVTIAALTSGIAVAGTTVHRMNVTGATGSGGATTYLQSSSGGGALQGEVATSARTNLTIPFGVLGEYDYTGGRFGVGVLGISTTGYGVAAESLSATQPSLIALNSSGGPGLAAYGENGGDAITGLGLAGGRGLYATSDSNHAVDGVSTAGGHAGVFGDNQSSNAVGFGVYGQTESNFGSGVYGYSAHTAAITGDSESNNAEEPSVQAVTYTPGTQLFEAEVANASSQLEETMKLQSPSLNGSGGLGDAAPPDSNDLAIAGDIYLNGGIFTGCGGGIPVNTVKADCGEELFGGTRSSGGTNYRTFVPKQTTETLEDTGEAQLVSGRAHVALDPAFASTISTAQPYMIFMTPAGQSHGLYFTNRTPAGFDVRENDGGKSTLAFDYRIVAHPYGKPVERMAAILPSPVRVRPEQAARLAKRATLMAAQHRQALAQPQFVMPHAPAPFANR